MNIDCDDSENAVNQTVSLYGAMLLMWARLSLSGLTFVFALIRVFVTLDGVGEKVTAGVIQLSVQLLPSPFSTHCANAALISVSFATKWFPFCQTATVKPPKCHRDFQTTEYSQCIQKLIDTLNALTSIKTLVVQQIITYVCMYIRKLLSSPPTACITSCTLHTLSTVYTSMNKQCNSTLNCVVFFLCAIGL